MMRVAVIGAGLAGLACATRLAAAGHMVSLLDKGRGPGGRMSSRRVQTAMGEAAFDHGAQYFTVRDPAFRTQVLAWQQDGLAALWPAAGPDCWVGTPAMNAPLKQMAASLDVRWNRRVEAAKEEAGRWTVSGDGFCEDQYDTLILAVPAENAGPLLQGMASGLADRAVATPAAPCWTVMAAFAAPLPAKSDIIKEQGPIGWAARNSAKPGRTGPESWVIQAGPDWSALHLEEQPEAIVPVLLCELAARLGSLLPDVLTASAHRWQYARSGNSGDGVLWDAARRIGVCGDWLMGPRVECAWVSGNRLAAVIG